MCKLFFIGPHFALFPPCLEPVPFQDGIAWDAEAAASDALYAPSGLRQVDFWVRAIDAYLLCPPMRTYSVTRFDLPPQ